MLSQNQLEKALRAGLISTDEYRAQASPIILRRRPEGWTAQDTDATRMREVARLFGGATELPTAWTAVADSETVRRGIEKLNPGRPVVVEKAA